jgi:hypothetical protein
MRQLRILLFLCVAFAMTGISAQAQVLLSEGFEGPGFPGWTLDPTGNAEFLGIVPAPLGRTGNCVGNYLNATTLGGAAGGSGQYMRRVIPSGGKYLRIICWWRQEDNDPAADQNVFESDDYFEIHYRPNAVTRWTQLYRATDDVNDAWTQLKYFVMGGADFELRIGCNSSASDEKYWWDDLTVEAYTPQALNDIRRRIEPLTFTPGSVHTVNLHCRGNAYGGDIRTSETVATGVTISDISDGGVATGQVINWLNVHVDPNTTKTLTYKVTTPSGTGLEPKLYQQWQGRYTHGTDTSHVGNYTAGDNAIFLQSDPLPTTPAWFGRADISEAFRARGYSAYYAADTGGPAYYVFANGRDMWNNDCEFHFLYLYVVGQFRLSAQVEATLPPEVNNWEKGGIMVRESLLPRAAFVNAVLRSNAGGANEDDIYFQERRAYNVAAQRFGQQAPDSRTGDANAVTGTQAANVGPAVLILSRNAGSDIINAGYDNLEGDIKDPWYGISRNTIPIDRPVLVGLCFSSHHDSNQRYVDRVKITNVQLTAPMIVRPVINTSARVLSATAYTSGTNVRVTVNLNRFGPGALTVREVLSPGWTAANATGATVNSDAFGTTVTFTGVNADSVQYDAVPPANMRVPGYFKGSAWDAYNFTAVTAPSSIRPAGRVTLQDGVYPDPTYYGTVETHITYNNGGGGVHNNMGQNALFEEGDWYGTENFRNVANPGVDIRTYPGRDDNKIMLLRFDLTPDVPSGATIAEAWLRLFYDSQRRTYTSGVTVAGVQTQQPYGASRIDHHSWVHALTKSWGEGVGTGIDGSDAVQGEVTWVNARLNLQDWQTSGARGLNDIVAPSQVSARSAAMYGVQEKTFVDYDITSLVQYWTANPAANFGMKISQDDEGYRTSTGYHWGAYQFASSEYTADPLLRPMLTVRFIPSLNVGRWSMYR